MTGGRIGAGSLLGLMMMASGCQITLSEDSIFGPPTPRGADTVAEMDFRDQETLTDPQSELAQSPALEGLLPATVQHGFVDYESGRIAWSLTSAVGEDPERPVIVTCVGRGGDRPNRGVYYARKILPWGDVLQFDYPGYGDSTGTPSIDSIKASTPAIVELAESRAGERPLIYWGHSLGGFICPRFVAASPQADGLVYEATALSVEEASEVWKPWYLRFLPIDMVPEKESEDGDNADPVRGFDGPVLVLTGGKDDVLPAFLGRSLADKLERQGNDVTYVHMEEGSHVDIPLQPGFVEATAPVFERMTNQN
jgi:pimeloyl-ACP methyl ester carboxylesterase